MVSAEPRYHFGLTRYVAGIKSSTANASAPDEFALVSKAHALIATSGDLAHQLYLTIHFTKKAECADNGAITSCSFPN
jgi:hypothetical protein